MATRTIHGTGEKGMTIHGGGDVHSAVRDLSVMTTSVQYETKLVPNNNAGMEPVRKGNAVSLSTQLLQATTTGFVKITKTSHGLVVGQLVRVYGNNVTAYNCIHKVTEVLSSSTVKTDIPYTEDSTTAGSYYVLSATVGNMTQGKWLGTIIGDTIAGVESNILTSPGANDNRLPYNVSRGNNRYHITSWNAITGRATKGANAGDSFTYHSPVSDAALAFEPYPTRAIPGEFVYMTGAPTPTQADYNALT